MPKSKRSRPIHQPTQVQPKGRALKEKLYDGVCSGCDTFAWAWVFDVSNMRNAYLKDVREDWRDSRIIFGRTKVMAKALASAATGRKGVAALLPSVAGSVGLLFTNREPDQVQAYFDAFARMDYARAGVGAPQTVTMGQGTVYAAYADGGQPVEEEPMAAGMEPTLRTLGMPTRLCDGVVTLDTDYTICREGAILDSNQTRLLKMFGMAQSEFRVRLIASSSMSCE